MVIDNRENGRVIDALTEAISKGADLKFITRQLSLFAYLALQGKLKDVSSLKLLLSQSEMFPEEMGEISPLLGGVQDRENRNKLLAQAIAKQFDEWLKNVADIKYSHDSLNANHYEVVNDDGDHTVINGSSTLTSSGLGIIASKDHEMNHLFTDDENVQRLEAWFN